MEGKEQRGDQQQNSLPTPYHVKRLRRLKPFQVKMPILQLGFPCLRI